MMNKKHIVFLITVFWVLAFAQSSNAQIKNSVYSMFGIGKIIDNSFGINKTLGGTGIAFQSGRSINHLNPASYLGIMPHSFVMEIGAYGIYNSAKNTSTSQTMGDINVNFFSAGLYVTNWWAFCFGLVPLSDIDYEINSRDEIGGELTYFEKNFKGTGGLSRVFLGSSFKLYKGLAVGFNTYFLFGPITTTETAVSNDNFAGYEFKNKRTAYSVYVDYGLQYSIRKNDWFYSIGLVYGTDKKLHTTDDLEFTYNETTSYLEQDDQLDIRIPQKIGLGLSVKKGNNFRAGFDYQWENWSNIKFSNPNLETKDSHWFSSGVEYSPYKKSNWFKSLYYRMGINYKNSYLEIDNTRINSSAVNFGVGIPLIKMNMINLSLEYGEEGTLKKGLIKNNYWLLYFSFSLHEFWVRH